jgi:hypothetical protein
MFPDDWPFEIAKLAAQLIGAGFIAWLTVSLALGRFKKEKLWERQLSAYAEAVASLAEMRLLVGGWFDQAAEHRDLPPELEATQRTQYQAARRRLDEAIATGQLLFPKEVAAQLAVIPKEMESANHQDSYLEHLDTLYGVLDTSLSQLIASGRNQLAQPPA